MGNAESSAFPFKVGEEVTSYQNSRWKLYNGTRSAGGEAVSIFTFDKNARPDMLPVALNALQKLRTLRHPNVIKFIDGVDLPTHIHIVTEPVLPFSLGIEDSSTKKLSAAKQKQARSMTVTLGLHQIISALEFVNESGKMIHGNLHTESIFITKGGDWKLGGLDVITPQENLSDVFKNFQILPAKCRPPELSDRQFQAISRGPVSAVDAWCLGCLIYECFNETFRSADQLSQLGNIPPQLHAQYKRLLHTSVSQRLDPRLLLKSPLFQNNLVKCVNFVENMALKTNGEKEKFFQGFSAYMDRLPPRTAKYKILPCLINALEYGSGMSCFATILTAVLKIGNMLAEDEYARTVIPSVVKLFSSNERAVRVNLLQSLANFVDHLSESLVTKEIFPHVVTGFSDSLPLLRETTVKSMPLLVPKLPQNTVETQVVKYLSNCQTDQVAAIRTNTTYCLAKISPHMSSQAREKVLIPAFVRALRDGFAPSRVAGLKSLGVVSPHMSPAMCCQKVLPAVSPFLMDPVKDVRQAALQVCQGILIKMGKHSETMTEALPATGGAGEDKKQPAAGQGGAAYASSVVGSLGSWAASSIAQATSKMASTGAAGSNVNKPAAQAAGNKSPRTTARPNKSVQPKKSAPPASTSSGWDDDFFGDDADDASGDPVELSLSTKAKPKPKAAAAKPARKVVSRANKPRPKPAARKPKAKLAVQSVADVSVGDLDSWGDGGDADASGGQGDDGGGWGDWGDDKKSGSATSDDGFGMAGGDEDLFGSDGVDDMLGDFLTSLDTKKKSPTAKVAAARPKPKAVKKKMPTKKTVAAKPIVADIDGWDDF